MLKLLLFDAFRTLFDTKDTHTVAVRRILESQNITGIDIEAFHRQWDVFIVEQWSADGPFRLQWDMFEDCLDRTFRHFEAVRYDARAGIEIWKDLVASAPPFPEAAPVLAALNGSYRTAIVSNSDNFEMDICLSRLGADFDAVFTSENVRSYKPRPELFQAALEEFGARPDEAIMIGDSLNADVAGAHNAGLRAVWINRGGGAPKPGGPVPDFTLPDLTGLPALLQSLQAPPEIPRT